MPKVRIEVSERVIYSVEVDMSDSEWHELDRSMDQIGKAGERALDDMVDRYIKRDRDWQDADQLELHGLSLVLED